MSIIPTEKDRAWSEGFNSGLRAAAQGGVTLDEIRRLQIPVLERMGWLGTKTPLEQLALVYEELTEVMMAARELGKKMRAEVDDEQLGDEISDVIIRSVMMAHEMGLDLEAAIRRKLAKNQTLQPKGLKK